MEYAIWGFHSVTLSEEGHGQTASVLVDELGFTNTHRNGKRFRYETPSATQEGSQLEEKEIKGANIVDVVVCMPQSQMANIGIGSVHHVAWRTPTDAQQRILRQNIVKAGLNATPVIDRFYFHSVYFREPGGILFEIATKAPDLLSMRKQKNLVLTLSCLRGMSLTVKTLRKLFLQYTGQTKKVQLDNLLRGGQFIHRLWK